jgi:hypothetical protein
MATLYDLTTADIGRTIPGPGSITAIQAVARGVGTFSITDPALNAQRLFWQPLISISTDYSAPVLLSNANSSSTLEPQLNLVGASVAFGAAGFVVDSIPSQGTWRVTLA